MFKQSSAGVVIYSYNENNSRIYLLLQYPGRYWDFPKGKLEKDEKWTDAAIRESKEETGLSIELENGFEYTYTYFFNDFKGNKIEKTVVFFISRVNRDCEVILSHEHIDFLWLQFEQARIQVYFDSVRVLIDEVELFLNKKYKNNLLIGEK